MKKLIYVGLLLILSAFLVIKYSNWQTYLGMFLFGWMMNIENRLVNKK